MDSLLNRRAREHFAVLAAIRRLSKYSTDEISELADSGQLQEIFPFTPNIDMPPDFIDEKDIVDSCPFESDEDDLLFMNDELSELRKMKSPWTKKLFPV